MHRLFFGRPLILLLLVAITGCRPQSDLDVYEKLLDGRVASVDGHYEVLAYAQIFEKGDELFRVDSKLVFRSAHQVTVSVVGRENGIEVFKKHLVVTGQSFQYAHSKRGQPPSPQVGNLLDPSFAAIIDDLYFSSHGSLWLAWDALRLKSRSAFAELRLLDISGTQQRYASRTWLIEKVVAPDSIQYEALSDGFRLFVIKKHIQ